MKQATTIQEQIKILRSRGMLIDDDKYAESILLDIGYYKLGFYCTAFEVDYPNIHGDEKERNHKYRSGASLRDVVSLYEFDCSLRDLLGTVLHQIENNFRTRVCYYGSIAFIHSPTWFVDDRCVTAKFARSFDDKVYKPMLSLQSATTIKRHHRKYINDRYAPAWKTLEYMTFGAIIQLLFSVTNKAVQQSVADSYGIKDPKVLRNYIIVMRDLRNLCAHSSALFDARLNNAIGKGPVKGLSVDNNTTILGAILVAEYLLLQISVERADSFKKKLKEMVESYQHILCQLNLFGSYTLIQ